MLIPLKDVITKYALNLKGVIQVGCHWAEEHEYYTELGISKMVYIEPCKDAFNVLEKIDFSPSDVLLINCACDDENGEKIMYSSDQNQGQSNSLLKPKGHLIQHPEIQFSKIEMVKVSRLDDLMFDKKPYNLLCMDCQGAEGNILKGATETLRHIDIIYTEINTAETYDGNMLVSEMDAFLDFYDFVRVETKMASANLTWGDAVYLKTYMV